MEQELVLFQHIMSTISRYRENLKVIMLGNTISRFCPYFELFNIDHKRIKHGETGIIKHKRGVTIVVHRTKKPCKTNRRNEKA